MLKIYEKPTCTTCRKLRALLDEHNVQFQSIDYHSTGLRELELRSLVAKTGGSARDLLRMREPLVRELGLDDPAVDDELILASMVEHPALLQRPVVAHGDRALLARPIERVFELIE